MKQQIILLSIICSVLIIMIAVALENQAQSSEGSSPRSLKVVKTYRASAYVYVDVYNTGLQCVRFGGTRGGMHCGHDL